MHFIDSLNVVHRLSVKMHNVDPFFSAKLTNTDEETQSQNELTLDPSKQQPASKPGFPERKIIRTY